MFELTFGNWVPVARLLADSTNRVVWILILFDVIAVNFGIVRVISGMLLHETFKVASMDDDLYVHPEGKIVQQEPHENGGAVQRD